MPPLISPTDFQKKIVNRTVNPLLASLPAKFTSFAPEQIRAIVEVVAAFDETNVVVLDAPTGSGKTVIAEAVRRIVQTRRALYVCHSLGLQDQFATDFPYAKVIKGRSNYRTGRYPKRFPWVSCGDCEWRQDRPECSLCEAKDRCPYEKAKIRALGAELAVANMAYALTEWNGPGRFSGRDLVIVDEADLWEPAVVEHISVDVSERRMRQFGWVTPSKVTVVGSWLEWLGDHLPKAKSLLEVETDEKQQKYLERLISQLEVVQKGMKDGLPYAYMGRTGGLAVGFKPAYVGDYCKDAVWRHGKKWLLMSATVISAESLLKSLGYEGSYRLVTCPSTFPTKNRRVVVRPTVNMARLENYDDRLKTLTDAILREVDGERGRIVIHTVSYSLARDIHRVLERELETRQVYTYTMATARAGAISDYKREAGSILVAPSADRGIDLPDDLCRLCIIAKVPFPNLGDRMVSMRLHMRGGQVWYTATTIRTIVQMAGRGVRHKDDWCRTVILDSQFNANVWSRGKHLFPRWFKEAMVWENPVYTKLGVAPKGATA